MAAQTDSKQIDKTLIIGSDLEIKGVIGADKDNLNTPLKVANALEVQGPVNAQTNLTVNGDMEVDGSVTVGNTITTNNMTLKGETNVNGRVTIDGKQTKINNSGYNSVLMYDILWDINYRLENAGHQEGTTNLSGVTVHKEGKYVILEGTLEEPPKGISTYSIDMYPLEEFSFFLFNEALVKCGKLTIYPYQEYREGIQLHIDINTSPIPINAAYKLGTIR